MEPKHQTWFGNIHTGFVISVYKKKECSMGSSRLLIHENWFFLNDTVSINSLLALHSYFSMPDYRSACAHIKKKKKNSSVDLCLNQTPADRLYHACICLEAPVGLLSLKEHLLLIIIGSMYRMLTMWWALPRGLQILMNNRMWHNRVWQGAFETIQCEETEAWN